VTFLLQNKKKVDKFELCLKTAASLFPFSCMTFLIENRIISDYDIDIKMKILHLNAYNEAQIKINKAKLKQLRLA
jgi:hypothetical protein